MASGEDENFSKSMSQMSLRSVRDTVSAASASPLDSLVVRRRDEGLEGETLVGRNVVRRGLLNIDLNVVPPEGTDCELTAVAGGREAVVFGESESIFNGIGGERKKNTVIIVDAEAEIEEEMKRRNNRRWIALLEVAENDLREKEEEIRNRNRKRGPSPEVELGGDPQKGTTTRKRISGQRRQSVVTEWNGENLAAAAAAAAVVVRSSRGRAVAMPNKYRDSVLGAAATAELPRRNKSGKYATAFWTERRSR